MATKQQQAIQRAVKRENKRGKIREEKHVLGFLVALILILLYLLMAEHWGWWPYARPKLGSAFYTNVGATQASPAGTAAAGTSGTGNTSGSGSSGGNSGGGGTQPGASSGTTPISTFAAQVNVGDTKADTTTQANGLGQNCAVVTTVNSNTSAGKQEVCTYTEGDKIVTVTYLNDRVISASKSGF